MTTFGTLNPDGTLSNVREIPQSVLRRCPFFILDQDHYREDGTCKCNDPEYRKTVMYAWGYRVADFRRVGILPKRARKAKRPAKGQLALALPKDPDDRKVFEAAHKQCPKGFPMTIRSPKEWQAIAHCVNQGIDSHLEAITERSKFDHTTGECLVHPDELHVLVRRLSECGEQLFPDWDHEVVNDPATDLGNCIVQVLEDIEEEAKGS